MANHQDEFLSFYEAKAARSVRDSFQESLKVTLNIPLIRSNFENLRWMSQLNAKPRFLKMHKDIIQNYEENKETPEEFHRKMMFKSKLEEILNSLKDEGFYWRFLLVPTGSTVSGLAARKSDLDLCLYVPEFCSYFPTESLAARNILQIVRHIIAYKEEQGYDTNISKLNIVFASVPVLKINTKDGLEVDLSVCTTEFLSGAHNSILIAAFGKIDERFTPFCHFVKKWATSTGIKNPRGPNACFNSYAVICLIIHFFQCGVYPPILPNLKLLYPDHYAQSEYMFPKQIDYNNPLPPTFKKLEMKNEMCLGELFIRFLQYYRDFDFKKFYISLSESVAKKRGNKNVKNSVVIEDPIDSHNPGRTARDIPHIKDVIRRTITFYQNASTQHTKIPSVSEVISGTYLNSM